jgi:phosphatidylethanolamine-binding protein (PEBP) family uncharacterized protein
MACILQPAAGNARFPRRLRQSQYVGGFEARLAIILFGATLKVLWGNSAMAMTLNSPAFQQNGRIPSKYTCEGEYVSPPLAWEGVPKGAKSLALIIDDPDAPDPKAPKMVWVHWVVYNLPPIRRACRRTRAKQGYRKAR